MIYKFQSTHKCIDLCSYCQIKNNFIYSDADGVPRQTNVYNIEGFFCREFAPVDQLFYQQPIEYVRNTLSITQRRVLEELIRFDNKFALNHVGQQRIAAQAGCTIKTVNVTIRKLTELGFIKKYNRYNATCYYRLSSVFYNTSMRHTLSKVLTTLKFLSVLLLTVYSAAYSQEKTLQEELGDTNSAVLKFVYKPLAALKERLSLTRRAATKRKTSKEVDLSTLPIDSRELRFIENEKRKCMNPISQAIRDITELKLSKWGQIRLSVFADKAIQHGRTELQKNQQPLHHPFEWFYKVCLVYSDKNQVPLNWLLRKDLEERYPFPPKPAWVLAEYTPTPPTKGTEQDSIVRKKFPLYTDTPRDLDKTKEFIAIENEKKNNPTFVANLKKLGLPEQWNPYSPDTSLSFYPFEQLLILDVARQTPSKSNKDLL